jgi:enoyl-CoA hydratase
LGAKQLFIDLQIMRKKLMPSENIVNRTEGRVGIVQLNRPKAYNALSPQLMQELMAALEEYDADPQIGCLIITGNEKAFAAGADIKFMAGAAAPVDMLGSTFIDQWYRLAKISKPVIAAVSGFALGGGCELAMACDMIVASESAKFGQPEINLGVIPGAGGTQRMTRAVGKAVAMEMILNNRHLSAAEARQFGLVNKIVPVESYLDEAITLAGEIAARAPIALRLAKEAINAVYEMPLNSGLAHERNLFYMLFSTADQKEGMDAFINKRPANWQGK